MRRVWISALLLVALLVTACGGAPTAAPTATPRPAEPAPTDAPAEEPTEEITEGGQISIAGSTTVQPVAEKLGEAFSQATGVKVDVAGGGSSSGVKAAGDGTADIGNASRGIKQSELDTYPDLVIFTIAKDGIAIVAHPEVPVDEMTTEQVREIFAGNVTNWSEVGGPDVPITVISREEGSGTRGAFEEMVMGDDAAITDSAIFQDSNGKVRTAVSSTPNAIAYLSFGYLDNSVLAVSVDGVEPTVANAVNGTYPVVRPLNMVTLGEPTGVVKDFLDYAMSPEGQAVVVDEGFISVIEGVAEEESEPTQDAISIAGSTTVQPVAEKAAEAFTEMTGIKVDVAGGGSSSGVKAAGDGTADIGNASREIKQSELDTYPDLVIFTVAKDGIAIVSHPEGTVDELTTDQVREIFAGNITSWSEVGGPDVPITVISREEGSGTRGAFEEMVMGDDAAITDSAIFQDSNGKVRTAVSSTPDSIGFLSFGYLDNSVLAISVDGVEPTVENAVNGSYPVVRPLNMVTMGQPTGVVKDFLDFVLSEEGQAIVVDEGFISIAAPAAADLSGEQISIAGSTTVQPVAEKAAEAFMEMTGAKVDVAGGGSSSGVVAAGDGTADIGNASREIKQSELDTYPDLVIFTVAKDGIAIVAHPEVPVDELTTEQVREIFAGSIVNWAEVGGPDVPITVISREEGSGTRGAFEEMVMGDDAAITDSAIFQDSNGKVRTAVSSTPNSIGFLSFGYLDNSVLAISVDGVEPTVENAIDGTYPVVRPLNMCTNGEPTGAVKAFLDFVLSPEGQAIVVDEGFIAVK